MTRVLIVCEYGSLNGGERSLLSVLDGLVENGFQLRITGPADGPLAGAVAKVPDATYMPIELHGNDGRRLDLVTCRERLRAVITASGADLVHANSLSASRLAGPVVAELGKPSVGHLRDIMNVSAAVIADLNLHTRLLSVSRATCRHYIDAGVAAARIYVCYNGVNLQQFHPRRPDGFLHAELEISTPCPLVGAVGQIGMRKGLHLLIESAERIIQEIPDVHFVIVGGRYSEKEEAVQYERELRRRAASPPLAGRVHFLGVRDDVHRLLGEFTLLAHAARQEPLGRVLLEAAACGIPVVATNVGGTREIFPPASRAAMIVPPDDPNAFALAAIAVLSDKRLSQEMGAAARERVLQAFDARQAAAQLVSHYREALGWH
jgi:glycosyltransferase involved in cell wall biosynthesis